jgi:hypothetical protein
MWGCSRKKSDAWAGAAAGCGLIEGAAMQANAEPGPPKPPFDRERFVFQILAVVIGTQLLIYTLAAGVCGQRALEGGLSGRSARARWSSCRAALIPPSSCCWRCWVEQRCRGWTDNS